ncbi:uncharacterized protein LOC123499643 isoform X1 [Portunus trituberculatus]|uniref:uncharacterized protein LOC123499643 isoform X1 n=1 Tax=Portunus trituberculatus TaxID=210409 RepID=UPI001E1CFFE2|nr:uncharacterized protein LOC123499643 isoform X1 [Portunus trituberculatus]
MESMGVKPRPKPLLVAAVVVVAVVAAGPGAVTASSRNNERLYSSLHELTNVLREGFSTLAEGLRQERASREDFTRFMKAEVVGIRRAVQGLCRGVRVLSGGSDEACLDQGGEGDGAMQGAGHGGERGGGGTELTSLGGSGHSHVNVHEKIHSRDRQPTPTAPPPPDPMACPSPYHRFGNYCLTLLRERVNWEEARARCHSFAQSLGAAGEGDLAVVEDMDTFKAFVAKTDFQPPQPLNHHRRYHHHHHYCHRHHHNPLNSCFCPAGEAPSGMALVGGSADGWGGAWVWVDGSLIKQLPWLYSQTGHEGTVLAVDRDGIFHTIIRRTALWPLCQLK